MHRLLWILLTIVEPVAVAVGWVDFDPRDAYRNSIIKGKVSRCMIITVTGRAAKERASAIA